MASLLLRSTGRVLRRSLPQAPPAHALDNPRLFSSGGVNKHSSSHPLARLDESGHKRDIPEGMTSRYELIHMELDRVEKVILKNGEKIEQIQAAVRAKNEHDKMYYRCKAGFVGAAAVASGIAGVAVLAKKVLFG